MKLGSKLAIILFIVVAIAHLLRIVYSADLILGSWNAPMWVSVLGAVGPGVIAYLLWKESK